MAKRGRDAGIESAGKSREFQEHLEQTSGISDSIPMSDRDEDSFSDLEDATGGDPNQVPSLIDSSTLPSVYVTIPPPTRRFNSLFAGNRKPENSTKLMFSYPKDI